MLSPKTFLDSFSLFFYRVKELFLSIFGKSDKQHALEILGIKGLSGDVQQLINQSNLSLLLLFNRMDDRNKTFEEAKKEVDEIFKDMLIKDSDLK